ncbi:MAG: CsiV family protein [Gammaproteobacteria bacterium]
MKLRFLIPLLLTALLPGATLAQAESDAEALRLYDVELVIFKNIKAPKSREFTLPVSSPSRDENMLDLSSKSSVAAASELGYTVLSSDDYRLLEVVERLVESPRYELLQHVAWRQPGLDREQAMPVWLRGGRVYGSEYASIDDRIDLLDKNAKSVPGDPETEASFSFDEQTLEALELQQLEQKSAKPKRGLYEFEGKITIALGRYLHAHTDLVFRRPRLTVDPVTDNQAQQEYLLARAADTRILNNHRLKEHRRMRSKTLHYLDNPEFALLILITPYEPPVEASATDAGAASVE